MNTDRSVSLLIEFIYSAERTSLTSACHSSLRQFPHMNYFVFPTVCCYAVRVLLRVRDLATRSRFCGPNTYQLKLKGHLDGRVRIPGVCKSDHDIGCRQVKHMRRSINQINLGRNRHIRLVLQPPDQWSAPFSWPNKGHGYAGLRRRRRFDGQFPGSGHGSSCGRRDHDLPCLGCGLWPLR
jgi:hypothetical protein